MKLTHTKCQCSACKEYFNSTGAFDSHRKGKGKDRYCDTSGMVKNAAGYWVTALYEKYQKSSNLAVYGGEE